MDKVNWQTQAHDTQLVQQKQELRFLRKHPPIWPHEQNAICAQKQRLYVLLHCINQISIPFSQVATELTITRVHNLATPVMRALIQHDHGECSGQLLCHVPCTPWYEVSLAQLVGWEAWSCTQPPRFKSSLLDWIWVSISLLNENPPSSS
jgi:hypothetical protein